MLEELEDQLHRIKNPAERGGRQVQSPLTDNLLEKHLPLRRRNDTALPEVPIDGTNQAAFSATRRKRDTHPPSDGSIDLKRVEHPVRAVQMAAHPQFRLS